MNNSNTIILFEYFQVKIELLEFTEMHIDFMYSQLSVFDMLSDLY